MALSIIPRFKELLLQCYEREDGRADVAIERRPDQGGFIVHLERMDADVDYEEARQLAGMTGPQAVPATRAAMHRREWRDVGSPNPYAEKLHAAGCALADCLVETGHINKVGIAARKRWKEELGLSLKDFELGPIRMDMEEIYIEEATRTIRWLIAGVVPPSKPNRLESAPELYAAGSSGILTRQAWEAHVAAHMAMQAPQNLLNECISDMVKKAERATSEAISDDEFRRRAGFYVGGK